MRFVLLASASLVLALGISVGLAAGAPGQRTGRTHAEFRESTLVAASRSLKLRPLPTSGTTGGTFATAGGDAVRVFAANEYVAADPSFNQRWADLLAAVPHGDELQRVTIVLLPLADVQSRCGADALACYTPADETIVSPGEDPAPDIPAASILLHEYGHHVAANRSDDPWSAIDYGAKRWSSSLNICRQTEDGVLHPGDEGADYRLNPGEAWAETYRVVAEDALGLPSVAWNIVSRSFYPTSASLASAREDTVDPWLGNATSTANGSFRGAQKQRRVRIATPLDGTLALGLTNRTKSRLKIELADGAGNVLVTSSVAVGRTETLRSTICGQRSLQLRLSRTVTGAGSYSITISKP